MIVFDKAIADKPHAGFNSNVIKFHSNVTGKTPVRGVVVTYLSGYTNQIDVELTPDLNGKFRFNFLEISKNHLTGYNLEDKFSYPDLSTITNKLSFDEVDLYYDILFFVGVFFSDSTVDSTPLLTPIDTHFTKAVKQIGESTELNEFVAIFTGKYDALIPYYNNGTYTQHIKIWDGFPFDFAIPFSNENGNVSEHYIDINTNLGSANLFGGFGNDKFQRVVLIDNSSNELQSTLPFGKGDIKITNDNNAGFIQCSYEKVESCGGNYLKWLNSQGGWSYWLFSDYVTDSRNAKNLKDFNKNYDDISEITGTKVSFGKEVKDVKQLQYENATELEWATIQTIYSSPKIYLYKQDGNWLDVKIKNNSFITFKTNQKLRTVSLVLEMPEIFTQTI